MNRLFIVAQAELARRLSRELGTDGFSCYVAQPDEDVSHIGAEVVLVEVDEHPPYPKTEELCRSLKLERHLPLIAIVSRSALASHASELKALPCDDFVLEPYDRQEILLRIRKIIGDESRAADQQLIRHRSLYHPDCGSRAVRELICLPGRPSCSSRAILSLRAYPCPGRSPSTSENAER